MPLIDITCGPCITDASRARLAEILPHAVSLAVQCADEPYDHHLQPGDVLIRFHDVGPFDRFDIDALVEVKSKWFGDRAENRDQRAQAIHDAVRNALEDGQTAGVYLTLPVAAWDQSDYEAPNR